MMRVYTVDGLTYSYHDWKSFVEMGGEENLRVEVEVGCGWGVEVEWYIYDEG